jgi:SAM-dependent methyltransferase
MSSTPKENLALRTEERWRPPTFKPLVGRRARLGAAVRRFFDLQAGSLWRDLSPVLSRAEGTLLDVGCGAQPYRGLLPPSTNYVGLDTERAQEDFGYAMPDVLTIGDDGRWPVEDARADFVLATETLEHVVNPRAFLAEAHRCIRPGGRLILTVPFAARWHYIPHDYWRFTPSSLSLLLEEAGFGQVVVQGRGNEQTVAYYKLLALLLPLVLPQREPGAMRIRPLGLLIVPLVVLLATLGNLSLRGRTGDDCLGFTVYSVKPPPLGLDADHS